MWPEPIGDTLLRYRAALEEIRRDAGRVCARFGLCDHDACISSYAAWVIADKALHPETYADKGGLR